MPKTFQFGTSFKLIEKFMGIFGVLFFIGLCAFWYGIYRLYSYISENGLSNLIDRIMHGA